MKGLKKNAVLVALLAVGLTFVACKSELDGKPSAEVVDTKKDDKAAEKPADKKADDKMADKKDAKPADDKAGAAAKGAAELKLAVADSKIEAVGSKVTGDHTVTFKTFDGKGMIKDGNLADLSFTVQMGEIDNEIENAEFKKKLNDHLKSADFFDVANNPTSTFKSTAIEASKDAAGTHTITGDLTMRGNTKTIKFPATVKIDDKAVTGKAEFKINRQDFKMAYPGKKDDLIKDDVLLKIDLKFNR